MISSIRESGGVMGYLGDSLEILAAAGIPNTPADLVGRWEGFVYECETGYCWDISEYDNEIRARRALDLLIEAESLQIYPERDELVEVVKAIDDRFRLLLQEDVFRPGKEAWYERGVLRRAGLEYVRYFQAAYDIRVEGVDC